MGLFKKLFGKKAGGSFVGNFIRKGSQTAVGALSLVPGIGSTLAPLASGLINTLNPVPAAAAEVQAQASADVVAAASMPAQPVHVVEQLGRQAYDNASGAGASAEEAKAAARAVKSAAAAPQAFTKQEGRDVLNGIVDGAITGAGTSWANKTASGGDAKDQFTMDALKQYAPLLALGGAALFFLTRKR